MTLSRRMFLGAATATLAGMAAPRITLAQATTNRRFMLVILRGALDGLSAIPPHGDPAYAALRGPLAISQPVNLDGMFGLHPSLGALADWYRSGELLPVHAVATPYRDRSHFDAQDLLENGTTVPRGASDGWLGRALTAIGTPELALGLAIGQTVPLILRGGSPVTTWSPSILAGADPGLIERLNRMYAGDPLFSQMLSQALAMGDIDNPTEDRTGGGASARLAESVRMAASMLAAADGPRVAVLDGAGAWDTHANQGADSGRLANQLTGLADMLIVFRQTLGPVWAQTVLAVVTEFGRSAIPNGTGGTDHGTGAAIVLAGGAIQGGRILADWPGLSANHLLDGRDLRPTIDMRSVLKGILRDHFGVAESVLASSVFPESGLVRPIDGLISG